MNPMDGKISGTGGDQPVKPPSPTERTKKASSGDAVESVAAKKLQQEQEGAAAASAEDLSKAIGELGPLLEETGASTTGSSKVSKLIKKFEDLSSGDSKSVSKQRESPKSLSPAPASSSNLTSSQPTLSSLSSSSFSSSDVSSSSTSSVESVVEEPLLAPQILAPETEERLKGKEPKRAIPPSPGDKSQVAQAHVEMSSEIPGAPQGAALSPESEKISKKNKAFKIWRQVAKLPKPVVQFVTGLAVTRANLSSQDKLEQYPRELIQKLSPTLFALLPEEMLKRLDPKEIQSLSNHQLVALGPKIKYIAEHLTNNQKNVLSQQQKSIINEAAAAETRATNENAVSRLIGEGQIWEAAQLKTQWMPVRDIESSRFNTVVLGLNSEAPSHAITSTLGDTFGFVKAQFESNFVSVQDQHTQYVHADGSVNYDKLIENSLDNDRQHVLFSDDTVMTRMTLEALSIVLQSNEAPQTPDALQTILDKLRIETKMRYCRFGEDNKEANRGTGGTIKTMVKECPTPEERYRFIPGKGDGCGGSMRCMVFGDMFYGEANREILLKAVVDNVAITHTNPVGIVGGLSTALMTAYAKENVPFYQWMDRLLVDTAIGGVAYNYALNTIPQAKENQAEFDKAWDDASNTINLQKLLRMPIEGEHPGTYNRSVFPDTIEGRQSFARQLARVETKVAGEGAAAEYAPPIEVDSHGVITKNKRVDVAAPGSVQWTHTHALLSIGLGGWPGRNGDDAAMLPYDYLMLTFAKFAEDKGLNIQTLTPSQFRSEFAKLNEQEQRQIFDELLKKACWHEGDSDTTGTIALGIWGAFMGTSGIPPEISQKVTSNDFW